VTRPLKKGLKYGIVLILIIGILLGIFDIVLRINYPKKYEEHVNKYAEENGLDPLLVFAIIKTESNFDTNVVSSSKAIGLMQLLETTAKEKAEKQGNPIDSAVELYDPELNINLGCDYFAELLKAYNGNMNLAIAAYNAGIGNVNKWIKEGIIKEDGSDIENIPYKETNIYVRKIIRNYKIYQNLY